ncbi:MAG: menaquinone biosynthesis decarboxylase [Helicobacteraceae bacterium]|jgi:4-hydroxy-3-polyprenylbenzoate decarboxylase|nr:menaquinone biosynthesis decarboxylase [Helicobacteraceae bacterium]
MRNFVEKLQEIGELEVICEPLDANLEIAALAYAEVKKENGGKALLFKNVFNGEKKYDFPVLMNLYGSHKRVREIFGKDIEEIASEVDSFVRPEHPTSFFGKIKKIASFWKLRNIFPKRSRSRGECQEVIVQGDAAKLSDLPILKTWKNDGGAFITMGQVYTRSVDNKMNNVGMYRLQVFDDQTLGLHWQIHKDSSNFFAEYEEKNIKMPVSIAIGGDPLYVWCATAPLPKGIFELLLYGFIRRKRAKLVKCVTNDLFVPNDADFVIEGYIENTRDRKIEGEFGDHTGYYTPKEPYPFMKVTAITRKKTPIYYATIVGKPPIEDKYMGYPTERIFLPLFRANCPHLIDYKMPENGVFHNLILAKIKNTFAGQPLQAMHAFWGVGQMSFVKHAIFVGADAPDLNDYEKFFEWCLNRFSPEKLLVSNGVLDALDHSSRAPLVGGKLGLDCTGKIVNSHKKILTDPELFNLVKPLVKEAIAVKQYGIYTANPVALLQIDKIRSAKEIYNDLSELKDHFAIAIVLDNENNDINNAYMSVWRICNNIDAIYDLIVGDFVFLDATNKDARDGFNREWPKDTDLDEKVVEKLREKGLWQLDKSLEEKFQLFKKNKK